MLNQAAYYLDDRGRYPEAVPLLQRALAIYEQELGPTHPNTASSLNNLAGLYESQCQYSEALPLYQRALAICKQELGPDHPNTVTIRENYADLLKKVKRKRQS